MKNRGMIGANTIADRLESARAEMNARSTNENLKRSAQEAHTTLICVDGRLNRKNKEYVAKNLILLEGINKEVKKYCRGIDVVILNYLVYKGLESIKKQSELEIIDYSQIENLYK